MSIGGTAEQLAARSDAIDLPSSVEGLTAAWLTEALQVRWPGATVTSAVAVGVRHGSNTTARLVLDYDRVGHGAGLPATMYAKGAWTDRGTGGTFPEGRFYQEIAPLLADGVNIPQCFYAGVDATTMQAVLLLEDLRASNALICGPHDELTIDHALMMVAQLARLHTLWAGLPDRFTRPWMHPTGTVMTFDERLADAELGIFGSFKEGWWNRRIAAEHARVVPAPLNDRSVVKQALVNLYRAEAGAPMCLVHGDPHLGNIYIDRQGRPGLYDWTGVVGRWAHDVNYAVIGMLPIGARREAERDVLHHYLATVEALGGAAPPWDEAWLTWRRQSIHGFLWVMCSPRQQPEDLIALQTERFTAAAIDHGMLEALGV